MSTQTKMTPAAATITHVAYYSGDEYGSDGLYSEGIDAESAEAGIEECCRECGFPDCPDATVVNLSELSDLDAVEFDDFVSSWGLAHNNGWTSQPVMDAIVAEYERRGEPRISGSSANRILA